MRTVQRFREFEEQRRRVVHANVTLGVIGISISNSHLSVNRRTNSPDEKSG